MDARFRIRRGAATRRRARPDPAPLRGAERALAVVEYRNGPASTRTRAPRAAFARAAACWRNEFAVVERLAAAGVDVAQKNDAGCGFAHWLACAPRDAGDLRPLAAWLAARLGPAALAVEPNGHGHTCLHKAAFAGHFDLCAYLVSCFRGVRSSLLRVDIAPRPRRVDGVLTVYVFVASKAYRWGRVRLDAVASTPSTDVRVRLNASPRHVQRTSAMLRHRRDATTRSAPHGLDATGGRASDDADAAGHPELRYRRHADRALIKRAAARFARGRRADAVHVRHALGNARDAPRARATTPRSWRRGRRVTT